jgi:tetratricopeptide (TPR) repeat protein
LTSKKRNNSSKSSNKGSRSSSTDYPDKRRRLSELYSKKLFREVVNYANSNPSAIQTDPLMGQVVAASYFMLGDYENCIRWCETCYSSLANDSDFSSMYGAALRRLARFDEAESVFTRALQHGSQSKELKNNFSNLLIDLGRFDQARALLDEVLLANPGYQDAMANLTRLKFMQDISSNPEHSQEVELQDPLLEAFGPEETTGIEHKSITSTVGSNDKKLLGLLPNIGKGKSNQELLVLARALIGQTPDQALTICTQLHKQLPLQPCIYEIAGEAYIGLKQWTKAELCWLIAITLGTNDPATYLNLANISHFRGDDRMSSYWLEKLTEADPHNSKIEEVKRNLTRTIDPHLVNPFATS